ncbi:lysoplasmalogenase [Aestuariirhabdus sp. Z084]|uniref:lysoplasmalogenase n=1 Tax=Aestuariirhabdus haliotis TaxID=2918751 RepID=UPI00201B4072|nr:lysoplasmalogenase [Aestuariirhabdus haliotis]MCL6416627.1 lysoplasmalogenase [Aestuariirhabdus haliotis]MCL6420662.1 lysoplasmalogenase [Aestuariirhabdus haliotis]
MSRLSWSSPWFVFAAIALVYLLTIGLQPFPLDFLLKALPIWVLAWIVFRQRTTLRHNWLLAGLLCSSMGDLLLAWNQFVPGLGSFLVAHLFYIAAFVRKPLFSMPRLALALATLAVTSALLVMLLPALGEMTIPVVAYISVIVVMALCTILGKDNHPLVMAGALSFLLSDSMIAIDRFLSPFGLASLFIMITYYLAQLLITRGALKSSNVSC